MAYCVTDNHARQEQVFEVLGTGHAWNNSPDQIRRMLTEKSVPTDDKRVLFIGADAYLAAGGAIERDLFSEEGEGYLLDVALVERLVSEKLAAEAERIKTQGWAWTEHAAEFPWNHRRDYRAINPVAPALTEEEDNEHAELSDELDEIENSVEDVSELDAKTRERLTAIQARLAELDAKQPVYADEQMAKAGVFVSIADDGSLHIEPGFRRHADIMAEANSRPAGAPASTGELDGEYQDDAGGETVEDASDLDDLPPVDEDSADLPDRLMTELTAYHSLGLRNALAADHAIAYLAVLHALTLKLFYRGYTTDSCLQIAAHDTLVAAFRGPRGIQRRPGDRGAPRSLRENASRTRDRALGLSPRPRRKRAAAPVRPLRRPQRQRGATNPLFAAPTNAVTPGNSPKRCGSTWERKAS